MNAVRGKERNREEIHPSENRRTSTMRQNPVVSTMRKALALKYATREKRGFSIENSIREA